MLYVRNLSVTSWFAAASSVISISPCQPLSFILIRKIDCFLKIIKLFSSLCLLSLIFYLLIYLCTYLSIYLSIYQCTYPSIYLCTYPSMYLLHNYISFSHSLCNSPSITLLHFHLLSLLVYSCHRVFPNLNCYNLSSSHLNFLIFLISSFSVIKVKNPFYRL